MWGNTLAHEEEQEQQEQRRPVEGAQFLQHYPPPPPGGGFQGQPHYNEYENGYGEDDGALTSAVNLFSSAASAVFTSGGAAAKELASQGQKAASQLAAAAAPPPTQPPTQLGHPQNRNQQQCVPSSIVPENSMLDAAASSEEVFHAEAFVPPPAVSQAARMQQVFTSESPSNPSIAAPFLNSSASIPPTANTFQHGNPPPKSGVSEQNTGHISRQSPVQANFASTNTPVSSPYVQHSMLHTIVKAGAQPIQPSLPSTPSSQNKILTEKTSSEIAPCTAQFPTEPLSQATPKPRSAPLMRPAELNRPSLRTTSLKVPVPRASTPKLTRQWGGFKTPSSGGLPRSHSSTPTVSNQVVHSNISQESPLPPSERVDDTQPVRRENGTNTASAQILTQQRKEIPLLNTQEINENEMKNNDALSEKDQSVAQTNDSLPKGWTAQYDQNTGIVYYYNALTDETSWECPQNAEAEENLVAEEYKQSVMSTDSEVANAAEIDKDGASQTQKTNVKAPNESLLPQGWVVKHDSSTGSNYYLNTITNERTWELPAGTVGEGEKPTKKGGTSATEEGQKVEENALRESEVSYAKREEDLTSSNLDESLPEEWVAQRDTCTGRVYYCNSITNQTTWEKPLFTAAYSSLEMNSIDYLETRKVTESTSLDSREQQQYELMEELNERASLATESEMDELSAKQSPEVSNVSAPKDQKLLLDADARGENTDNECSIENSSTKASEVAIDTIDYDASSYSLNGPITINQSVSNNHGNQDLTEDSTASRPRQLDSATRESESSEVTQNELQDSWEEKFDENSGKSYYFNKTSNITTWERPTKSEGEYANHQDDKKSSQECTLLADNDKIVANSSVLSANVNEIDDGWIERIDESSGQIYYFNIQTNETKWDKPLQHRKLSEEESREPLGDDTVVSMQISADVDEDTNTHDPLSDVGIPNDEWVEELDQNTGKPYYLNKLTSETTWTKPIHLNKKSEEKIEIQESKDPSMRIELKKVQVNNSAVETEALNPPTCNSVDQLEGLSTQSESIGVQLPDGWQELTDEMTGNVYYYNSQTNETSWERPAAPQACVIANEPEERHEITEDFELENRDLTKEDVGERSDGRMHEMDSQVKTATAEINSVCSTQSEGIGVQLPEGWQELTDEMTGNVYYYNSQTNETSWERPAVPQTCVIANEPEERHEITEDFELENRDLTKEDIGERSDCRMHEMDSQVKTATAEINAAGPAADHSTKASPLINSKEPNREQLPIESEENLVDMNDESGKADEGNLSTTPSYGIDEMALLDGWVEANDESTGRVYYYNSASGQTSWDKPAVVAGELQDNIKSKEPSPEWGNDVSALPPPSVMDIKTEVEESLIKKPMEPQTNSSVQLQNESTDNLAGTSSSQKADALGIAKRLRKGWSHQTDTTGASYYVNDDTGETSWDPPQILTAEDYPEQSANDHDQPNIEPELDESTANDNFLETEGVILKAEVESNIGCIEETKTNTDIRRNGCMEQDSENDIPTLPDGWIELKDESSGQNYYLNETTQQTTWNRPSTGKEFGLQIEDSNQMEEKPISDNSLSLSPKNSPGKNSHVDSSDNKHLHTVNHSSIEGNDCIIGFTEKEDLSGNSVEERHFHEPDESEEIPTGWEKLFDEGTGKPYFFNKQQNISSWDLPVVKDVPVAEESSSQNEKLAEQHQQGKGKGSPSVEAIIGDEVNVRSDIFPDDSSVKDNDGSANLADGWVALVDENTGQPYYFNEEKNMTRWELPQEDDQNLGSTENIEYKNEVAPDPIKSINESETPEKTESNANLSHKRIEALPEGWVELSDSSGNTYYFNKIDQRTTWERPIATQTDQELKIEQPEKVELVVEKQDSLSASTNRSSSNDTVKRAHPNRGFASFGFGGRLCIYKPNSKGKVEILKVNSLLASHPIVLAESKKRDHGIVGALNCAKSDSVSSYIRGQVNQSSSDNLWSLIKIATESEGRLRSDEGVADTSSPESAMIQLFLQTSVDNGEDSPSEKSFEDIARDREALERVESLLLHGKREEAVEEAVSGNHFGLALLVAGMCGGKTFQNATKKFADKALLSGSPLYTLALLFSGNLEPPPDSALEKVGLMPTVWSNSTTALLHTWKQHLCAIISNRILGWDRIVLSLGDRLLELGNIQAAHCCYMVCGCPLSSVLNSSSRLTVIGCDHLVPMDAALLTQEGVAAFGRSEAYEWAKRKGNPDAVIQSLQAFKLAYAMLLADLGYCEEAESYVKTIRKCNASLRPPSVEFTNEKFPSVWNLSKEDLFPMLLDEFENRLLYEKNPQPHHQAGDDSLVLKTDGCLKAPSVISMPTNPGNGDVDTSVSSESPHDPFQFPNLPGESYSAVKSTKYNGDSSELQIQGAEDTSGERRPPPPLQKETKPIPSRSPAPEAPPTTVSPKPNHVAQLIIKSQSSSSEQMKMRSVEPAPNSVPIPLAATQEKLTNVSTPSFRSKKDLNESKEEKKPREAPHSAPPDLQKLQKKGAPDSDQKRSWGLGGLRNRMTKWLNPEATTADLGGTMEAYYDEDKKVWVFPGEDPNEVAKPIGPPPTGVIAKAEESKGEEKKPEPVSLDPLAAMMAPPPRAVSLLRRPGPGLPPSNSMPALLMPPGAAINTPTNGGTNNPPTFMVFKPNPDSGKENTEVEKDSDNL